MNPQLQNLAAISQIIPQQDPLQQLGGLLSLLTSLDQRGYAQQEAGLRQQLFDRQGQQMQFEQEMARGQAGRQDKALGMQGQELGLRGRQVALAEQRAPIDARYIQSQIQAQNTATDMASRRNELASQELQQQGLLGLLTILASPNGGGQMFNDALGNLSGLLGIMPQQQQADPMQSKRDYLNQNLNTNIQWQPPSMPVR